MLLSAFAAAAETVPEADYTTGTPWLYVDLAGNVTEETEANLKDNFALAANKEKLLKLELPAGYPCIGTGEKLVLQTQKDLARMFTEGTPATREAKLAFDLYALLMDWDRRNALGVAPLNMLGSIGSVIGHEICHAFDFAGSQMNAASAPVPLFSETDETAFLSLVQKVADYYSTIEVLPGAYENGDLLKLEAVADLAGLQITLNCAKSLGYQDLEPLFRSFAGLYAHTTDQNTARMVLMIDSHPAQYLRVNVNAQMSDEFYDVFAVKEGDNMYVAPEARLRIWGAGAKP